VVLHPGSLNYSVTVRNHAGRAVRLDPCPGYTESAAAWKDPATPHPAMIRRRYYLNCAAVGAIPAHSAVTFQMTIRIPAAMSHHQGEIDWRLDGHPESSDDDPVFVG
jgi:hypothetical protein